jgi:hypothetical protein
VKYIRLSERVDAAFDGESQSAFDLKYLEYILENWRDMGRSMRRSLIAVVLFMAAFVLLRGAKTAQVTVGPLRITNVSAILIAIPVVVAVLLYESTGYVAGYALFREVANELVRKLHPPIHDNDLGWLLSPPTISLLGGVGLSWEDVQPVEPGLPRKVLDATTIAIFVAVGAVSLSFLGYSYVYLYSDHHANTVAVSISLGLAVLFTVRTLAFLAETGRTDFY